MADSSRLRFSCASPMLENPSFLALSRSPTREAGGFIIEITSSSYLLGFGSLLQ